mmetsp:Transcript_22617/g.42920  ORF Transcript_22617/g.42920 Transcript_22617/m.42920 type:complete len:295 (-) Transcript_22617:761-1645(-)
MKVGVENIRWIVYCGPFHKRTSRRLYDGVDRASRGIIARCKISSGLHWDLTNAFWDLRLDTPLCHRVLQIRGNLGPDTVVIAGNMPVLIIQNQFGGIFPQKKRVPDSMQNKTRVRSCSHLVLSITIVPTSSSTWFGLTRVSWTWDEAHVHTTPIKVAAIQPAFSTVRVSPAGGFQVGSKIHALGGPRESLEFFLSLGSGREALAFANDTSIRATFVQRLHESINVSVGTNENRNSIPTDHGLHRKDANGGSFFGHSRIPYHDIQVGSHDGRGRNSSLNRPHSTRSKISSIGMNS